MQMVRASQGRHVESSAAEGGILLLRQRKSAVCVATSLQRHRQLNSHKNIVPRRASSGSRTCAAAQIPAHGVSTEVAIYRAFTDGECATRLLAVGDGRPDPQ